MNIVVGPVREGRMINIISIKAKSIMGNKGKTTVLDICEDALVKRGYIVTGNDIEHTLFAEKEDVLHPQKEVIKMECEIWLRSSRYIGDVKARDWNDLQKLLHNDYRIVQVVKTKIKVDCYCLQ